MKVLLFGYGLIGKERYKALIELNISSEHDIDIVDPNKGQETIATPNLKNKTVVNKELNFIDQSRIKEHFDLIIISAPHIESRDLLFKYSHLSDLILIEKPMGLNVEDAIKIDKLSKRNKNIYVGLNYRFFPPIMKLKQDLIEEKFGKILSISMTIGLGHQENAEKSWRLDPKQIPYGSLIDPGIHILDLIKYLFGDINSIKSHSSGNVWNKNFFEDIVFIAKTTSDANLMVNISNVMWRSTFKIQVIGTSGYGIMEGRGRSYGKQIYKTGLKWGWSQNTTQRESEIIVSESDCENSFTDELKDILIEGNKIAATSKDGLNAMKLLDDIDKTLKST